MSSVGLEPSVPEHAREAFLTHIVEDATEIFDGPRLAGWKVDLFYNIVQYGNLRTRSALDTLGNVTVSIYDEDTAGHLGKPAKGKHLDEQTYGAMLFLAALIGARQGAQQSVEITYPLQSPATATSSQLIKVSEAAAAPLASDCCTALTITPREQQQLIHRFKEQMILKHPDDWEDWFAPSIIHLLEEASSTSESAPVMPYLSPEASKDLMKTIVRHAVDRQHYNFSSRRECDWPTHGDLTITVQDGRIVLPIPSLKKDSIHPQILAESILCSDWSSVLDEDGLNKVIVVCPVAELEYPRGGLYADDRMVDEHWQPIPKPVEFTVDLQTAAELLILSGQLLGFNRSDLQLLVTQMRQGMNADEDIGPKRLCHKPAGTGHLRNILNDFPVIAKPTSPSHDQAPKSTRKSRAKTAFQGTPTGRQDAVASEAPPVTNIRNWTDAQKFLDEQEFDLNQFKRMTPEGQRMRIKQLIRDKKTQYAPQYYDKHEDKAEAERLNVLWVRALEELLKELGIDDVKL